MMWNRSYRHTPPVPRSTSSANYYYTWNRVHQNVYTWNSPVMYCSMIHCTVNGTVYSTLYTDQPAVALLSTCFRPVRNKGHESCSARTAILPPVVQTTQVVVPGRLGLCLGRTQVHDRRQCCTCARLIVYTIIVGRVRARTPKYEHAD